MAHRGVRWLLALALAGLLVACDGNSSGDPEPTLPPTPPTSVPIDVSKVPPTIDVPYVQAVMNALDQRTGDAVRVFVAQRGPNKEWYETFRAIFEDKAFDLAQSDFGRYAVNQLRPLRTDPGNPTTTVSRILDSTTTCIVAQIDRSYGPIFTTPPGSTAGYVQLATKRPINDPGARNPTTWAIIADINAEGAQIPEDPCR